MNHSQDPISNAKAEAKAESVAESVAMSATSRTLPSVERRGGQVRGREGNRLRAWLLQARYRRSEVRGSLLQRSPLYTFPLGAVASTSPAMVMWLYRP